MLDRSYRTSTQSDDRATHVHMTLLSNKQVSDCSGVSSDDQGCFVLAQGQQKSEVDSIEKLRLSSHAYRKPLSRLVPPILDCVTAKFPAMLTLQWIW